MYEYNSDRGHWSGTYSFLRFLLEVNEEDGAHGEERSAS
jgi:hypothetical protein